MENAVFDPVLTQTLANRLHAKSRTVIVKYTLISALLFSIAFYFSPLVGISIGLAPTKALGLGLLIGVVLGFVIGQRKSYQFRLAVQLVLCQLQIEKNTRIEK